MCLSFEEVSRHSIDYEETISHSRDRLVVRTLRCGRSNPGSNPGHGNVPSWNIVTGEIIIFT
ncbi:hypothetical protein FF38_05657 [Lucilia cuprina]|uniref:Uncharacterized protein n=1 Tax=Lucilia cuprina TaxID=7375 RepID=A0A0L0BY80_LUCCU|nr:hypothetical protein FF38_05657 [Lucilia cuprina]